MFPAQLPRGKLTGGLNLKSRFQPKEDEQNLSEEEEFDEDDLQLDHNDHLSGVVVGWRSQSRATMDWREDSRPPSLATSHAVSTRAIDDSDANPAALVSSVGPAERASSGTLHIPNVLPRLGSRSVTQRSQWSVKTSSVRSFDFAKPSRLLSREVSMREPLPQPALPKRSALVVVVETIISMHKFFYETGLLGVHNGASRKLAKAVGKSFTQHLACDKILVLNVIWFYIFWAGIMWPFVPLEFVQYVLVYVGVPNVLIFWTYYVCKFGVGAFSLTFKDLQDYFWNFLMLLCVSVVPFEIRIFQFVLIDAIYDYGLVYVLPTWLQFKFRFTVESLVQAFPVLVANGWFHTALILVMLPLHQKGYKIMMEIISRKPTMGFFQLAAHAIYFGAGSTQGVLADMMFFIIYGVHFNTLTVLLTIPLMDFMIESRFRFDRMHYLVHHAGSALEHIAHEEHHMEEAVFPNSSGMGVFESLANGGGILFTANLAYMIPYLQIPISYTANLIGHTMFPVKYLVSMHAYHHLVSADVFGPVPHLYEKNSMFLRKFGHVFDSAWEAKPLVLLVGLVGCFAVTFCICHFLFGWSFLMVLDQVEWLE